MEVVMISVAVAATLVAALVLLRARGKNNGLHPPKGGGRSGGSSGNHRNPGPPK